mgnify:CR=1 FL=1
MSAKKAGPKTAKIAKGKQRILVLHGPNLNLLGLREPGIYGHETLTDINASLASQAKAASVELIVFQSNHEGDLVDRIQAARSEGVAFIVLNPGGYTHTSIALHDAIKGTGITLIELHISNVFAREAFRHHSFIAAAVNGVICGFGSHSYVLALEALASLVNINKKG